MSLRALHFILKFWKKPLFLLTYLTHYASKDFQQNPRFYSEDEFNESLRKGKSVIRFGDGETYLINGGSLPAQDSSPEIGKLFKKIIRGYTNDSQYVICISRFIGKTNSELRATGLTNNWYSSKVLFMLLFPKKVLYGDAHFFYYDNFFKKYLEPLLLDKHVVVVTNESQVNALKNNTSIPFKKISYIIAPPKNAFFDRKEIVEMILNVVDEKFGAQNTRVVLAAGPASKAVAYELIKHGIVSYDVGTGIEAAYSGVSLEKMYPKLKEVKN